jgi:copper(I)-binding protein
MRGFQPRLPVHPRASSKIGFVTVPIRSLNWATRSILVLLSAAALLASLDGAADAPAMQISSPWARPTPPMAAVGVVYLSIHNRAAHADRLVALSTPAAAQAELHETHTVAGMMQMRAVEALDIPAGATVKSEPNGLHIMLLHLTHPLQPGSSFPLRLEFRDAGPITVRVAVENRE